MEGLVGITEFMTHGEFIGGILKHRRCDFIVNEIDLNGNVIEYNENQEEISDLQQPTISNSGLNDESINGLTSALGEENCEKIKNLVDEINAGNPDAIVELECDNNKESRTRIHQNIKRFAPGLGTSTDLTTNKIKVYNGELSNNPKKRKKFGIDARKLVKPPADFIEFTLWKENIESMAAIKQIARMIGTKDKYLGIAGNKDKRGITTQRVTVFCNLLPLLKSTNFGENIKVGNFKYTNKQLKLGDLKGNQFTVVIRNIDNNIPSEVLRSRLEELSSIGFVNYFGLQRFGKSAKNPTHVIGLAMIKCDYRKAVDLILGARDCKDPEEYKARETWEQTHNVEETLNLFPKRCYMERNILIGMQKAGGNETFLNGIMSLPRNSRTLYGHAYQSYIWNKAVSYRLTLSRSPIPGDLVLIREGQLKVLNEEELQNYSINDIVLPLPGAKIEFPKNEMAEFYQKLYDEDQVTIDTYTEIYKEMALSGDYRKIVAKPGNFEWSEISFPDLDTNEPSTGPIRSLRIKFALPSSSYATMCLREIMGNNEYLSNE